MTLFSWNTSFQTDLAAVDTHHRRLFNLINRLVVSVAAGARVPERALSHRFDQLRDCARHHFDDEEQLMVQMGLDPRHIAQHRAAHAQFVDQIETFRLWCKSMEHPAESLLHFLSAWLVQHIMGIDMSMAAQVRLLQSGQSPEHAYETALAGQDPRTRAVLEALRYLYQSLSRQNLSLEHRVQQRTEDLEKANSALVSANQRLEGQNLELERRVRERTADLERANVTLIDLNLKLQDFARMDGLLQIANRKSFDERYVQECLRARRDMMPLALLMIDVDFFKRYNDTYGHQAGDRCLQQVARAVAEVTRRPGDFVARYGGEELAVILPDTTPDGAHACAVQICRRVAALRIPHGSSDAAPVVTVSIGVASVEVAPEAWEAQDLLARADQALYRAKAKGRNRVCDGQGHQPVGAI